MSKVLKTGDVKRINKAQTAIYGSDKWCVVAPHTFKPIGYPTRQMARAARFWWWSGERIARVLSIGPKLVTVRIEK